MSGMPIQDCNKNLLQFLATSKTMVSVWAKNPCNFCKMKRTFSSTLRRQWSSLSKAEQWYAAVAGLFTPVSIFKYGDDQLANLSASFPSAKPSSVPSSPNSLSNFSQLALSSDLAQASETYWCAVLHMAVSSGGGPVVPDPPFELCAPLFMFGPRTTTKL